MSICSKCGSVIFANRQVCSKGGLCGPDDRPLREKMPSSHALYKYMTFYDRYGAKDRPVPSFEVWVEALGMTEEMADLIAHDLGEQFSG